MLILLPVCCWVLFFLFFCLRDKEPCWRSAFLDASVVLGTFIVLVTELLSLPEQITFTTVLISWLLLIGCGAWLLSRVWMHRRPLVSLDCKSSPKTTLTLQLGIGAYVLIIGLIAIISPPNSWDVMEYHMPKVMHYIQNQTLKFIPAHLPRVNHQNPGSEFVILHLQLLSGSDRFANMVEWFSMVGSLVAVSLIAQRLGAKLIGQLLAVIFSLTLPMGIMQASSSQADFVIAFWLACFIVYTFRMIDSPRLSYGTALLAAAALGLGIITKATTYVYAPAFGLWLLVGFIKLHKRQVIKPLIAMAAIVIALNAGHWVRNYDLHGKILGPGHESMSNSKYKNETIAPRMLLSNTVKYTALHLNTPWPSVQDKMREGIVEFHDWISVDVNDPRTSWGWPNRRRFRIAPIQFKDEWDGNPIHIILFSLCFTILPFFKRLRQDRSLILYGLSVLTGFLLFAFYVKWSIWNTRVHLGIFVVAGPFVALVLSRLLKKAWIITGIGLLLLVLGLPWLLNCEQRPIIRKNNIFNTSRNDLLFTHNNHPGQNNRDDYYAAQAYLKSKPLTQLGHYSDTFTREYLTWVFFGPDHPGLRIQHVNVRDISQCKSELPRFRDFQPEAIFLVNRRQDDSLMVNDVEYTKQWSSGRLAIYEKGLGSID
ncbi:hypothetical protein ACFL6U_08595 [Planctomycetota bacterium]